MGRDDLPELRKMLVETMERKGCGLRGLEELTGVSFATLSRFLRGEDITMGTLRRLQWFENKGTRALKEKPVTTKRFNIGKKVFLVEIRELKEQE